MKEHVATKHENSFNFKCDQCDKKYGTHGALHCHKLLTHQKFTCDICGKVVVNKYQFTRHNAYKHNIYPKDSLQCEHCPLFFTQESYREKHIAKQHPEKVDKEKNKENEESNSNVDLDEQESNFEETVVTSDLKASEPNDDQIEQARKESLEDAKRVLNETKEKAFEVENILKQKESESDFNVRRSKRIRVNDAIKEVQNKYAKKTEVKIKTKKIKKSFQDNVKITPKFMKQILANEVKPYTIHRDLDPNSKIEQFSSKDEQDESVDDEMSELDEISITEVNPENAQIKAVSINGEHASGQNEEYSNNLKTVGFNPPDLVDGNLQSGSEKSSDSANFQPMMEPDARNSEMIDYPQDKSDDDFTENFHESISFEDNVETSVLNQSFDERNNSLDDLTDNAKNRSDLTKNQLETIKRQSEEIEILKKQMNYMQTIQKQKEEIANLKKQLQYQEILLNSNVNNEPIEKEYTPKGTSKESKIDCHIYHSFSWYSKLWSSQH